MSLIELDERVPVFHNMCGQRTICRACDCANCRAPQDAFAKALRARAQQEQTI